MARYIDADELLASLQEELDYYPLLNTREQNEWFNKGLKRALRIVKTHPTADVVPKSEVEKLKNELLIWKQNRFNLYQKLECYEMARQKVAREIFEEADKVFMEACMSFDIYTAWQKLKEKYTEGEQ